MRPSAASMSAASSLPRSTPVDIDDSMRPRPALLAASSASTTTTSSPARAATSAMPEPMRPQPTTPIRVGVDGDAADSLMAANVAGDSGRWLSAGGASSPWRPDPCQLQRFEHTLKASAQSRSPLTGGETMDHAPIDQVADLRSPPPVGAPPELAIDDLARLFGIADLADRLTAVDQRIADALGRDGTVLAPAAARVASTGGKRLRPLLTIVAAALGDVFDDRVISAAAAVELVQVGSLVHDDILDRALTRRGQPTINAVEGLNHAVLAGDYILARAAELAASVSREAAALLADALGDLCEGQALELRDAFDPDRSIDDHVASIRGKTAALFACASRLGAHCGGVSPRNATALGRFGEAFGLSFQVLDDMLDLIGDAHRLRHRERRVHAAGAHRAARSGWRPAPGAAHRAAGRRRTRRRRGLAGDGIARASVRGRPGHRPRARIGQHRRRPGGRGPLRGRRPEGGGPPQPDQDRRGPRRIPPQLRHLGPRELHGQPLPRGAADRPR